MRRIFCGSCGPVVWIVLCSTLMWSFSFVEEPGGTASGAELRSFESQDGGFEVEIPPSLRVQELPPHPGGKCGYFGRFTSERDESYRFRVIRAKDYRHVNTFSSGEPEEIINEFAQRIASLGDTEDFTLTPQPTSGHGSDLSLFHIVADPGTDACEARWLLVGLEGKRWFEALWRIPCAESREHEEEIVGMIRSLRVKPSWRCEPRRKRRQ